MAPLCMLSFKILFPKLIWFQLRIIFMKKRRQLTCKPGSVGQRFNPLRGDHSSGTLIAQRLMQPTRMTNPKTWSELLPRHPYLVLLPVGFALPALLPAPRCALTAPFHLFLLPQGEKGSLLSVALSLGSPPPGVTRHRVSVEPGLSSLIQHAKASI